MPTLIQTQAIAAEATERLDKNNRTKNGRENQCRDSNMRGPCRPANLDRLRWDLEGWQHLRARLVGRACTTSAVSNDPIDRILEPEAPCVGVTY